MKKDKPKLGRLIRVLPSGKTEVLMVNKPFGVLQNAKKRYIQMGYRPSTLKVTYLKF